MWFTYTQPPPLSMGQLFPSPTTHRGVLSRPSEDSVGRWGEVFIWPSLFRPTRRGETFVFADIWAAKHTFAMVLFLFSKFSNLTFWRVCDRYGHHNSNSSLRHKHYTPPVATQHKYYTSPSASSRFRNHIPSGAAIQDRKCQTARYCCPHI